MPNSLRSKRKIEQVLALVKQLRAENDVLKNQLATADHERLNLRAAMDAARDRTAD